MSDGTLPPRWNESNELSRSTSPHHLHLHLPQHHHPFIWTPLKETGERRAHERREKRTREEGMGGAEVSGGRSKVRSVERIKAEGGDQVGSKRKKGKSGGHQVAKGKRLEEVSGLIHPGGSGERTCALRKLIKRGEGIIIIRGVEGKKRVYYRIYLGR
jgi:hypothetical protein